MHCVLSFALFNVAWGDPADHPLIGRSTEVQSAILEQANLINRDRARARGEAPPAPLRPENISWGFLLNIKILNLNKTGYKPKSGDFAGLENLRTLYLGFNQIEELPPGLFDSLHELKTLELAGNQLTWERILPTVETLHGLEDIRLNGNPIAGQDLKKAQAFAQDHGIQKLSAGGRNFVPTSRPGRSIAELVKSYDDFVVLSSLLAQGRIDLPTYQKLAREKFAAFNDPALKRHILMISFARNTHEEELAPWHPSDEPLYLPELFFDEASKKNLLLVGAFGKYSPWILGGMGQEYETLTFDQLATRVRNDSGSLIRSTQQKMLDALIEQFLLQKTSQINNALFDINPRSTDKPYLQIIYPSHPFQLGHKETSGRYEHRIQLKDFQWPLEMCRSLEGPEFENCIRRNLEPALRSILKIPEAEADWLSYLIRQPDHAVHQNGLSALLLGTGEKMSELDYKGSRDRNFYTTPPEDWINSLSSIPLSLILRPATLGLTALKKSYIAAASPFRGTNCVESIEQLGHAVEGDLFQIANGAQDIAECVVNLDPGGVLRGAFDCTSGLACIPIDILTKTLQSILCVPNQIRGASAESQAGPPRAERKALVVYINSGQDIALIDYIGDLAGREWYQDLLSKNYDEIRYILAGSDGNRFGSNQRVNQAYEALAKKYPQVDVFYSAHTLPSGGDYIRVRVEEFFNTGRVICSPELQSTACGDNRLYSLSTLARGNSSIQQTQTGLSIAPFLTQRDILEYLSQGMDLKTAIRNTSQDLNYGTTKLINPAFWAILATQGIEGTNPLAFDQREGVALMMASGVSHPVNPFLTSRPRLDEATSSNPDAKFDDLSRPYKIENLRKSLLRKLEERGTPLAKFDDLPSTPRPQQLLIENAIRTICDTLADYPEKKVRTFLETDFSPMIWRDGLHPGRIHSEIVRFMETQE